MSDNNENLFTIIFFLSFIELKLSQVCFHLKHWYRPNTCSFFFERAGAPRHLLIGKGHSTKTWENCKGIDPASAVKACNYLCCLREVSGMKSGHTQDTEFWHCSVVVYLSYFVSLICRPGNQDAKQSQNSSQEEDSSEYSLPSWEGHHTLQKPHCYCSFR